MVVLAVVLCPELWSSLWLELEFWWCASSLQLTGCESPRIDSCGDFEGGAEGRSSHFVVKGLVWMVIMKIVLCCVDSREWVSTEWMALLIRCLTTCFSRVSHLQGEQVSDSLQLTQTRASWSNSSSCCCFMLINVSVASRQMESKPVDCHTAAPWRMFSTIWQLAPGANRVKVTVHMFMWYYRPVYPYAFGELLTIFNIRLYQYVISTLIMLVSLIKRWFLAW